ncbi:hypothetical protein SLEP1_g44825 [Rubroshorea leprosula]|uniref:Uncharacterized protein n=1 Tax=Rubroshorea leprosula TaxID=152421 RepID=A0AAV5LHA8_9ROSI|nr:hypothetical protein SLEP1_g44825 [Rubroshorea leprosula]
MGGSSSEPRNFPSLSAESGSALLCSVLPPAALDCG